MMRWLSDIVAILIVGAVAVWIGVQVGAKDSAQSPSASENNASSSAGVEVTAIAVHHGAIPSSVTGYGRVAPIPGEQQKLSVPLESRVVSVQVIQGQRVHKGDALLTVAPSPDSLLQIEQARQDLVYAKQANKTAQQRFKLQLNTQAEVAQASNDLSQAQAKLDNLTARGLSGEQELTAKSEGIVSDLPWTPGAVVPPGESLIELAPMGALRVVLKIDPDEVGRVEVGQTVEMTPVSQNAMKPITGRVRSVTSRIDPSTQLIDVGVSLDDPSLMLGQYVLGKVGVGEVSGLIVPRSALIARDQGLALFTVTDGVAHEHGGIEVLAQDEHDVVLSAWDGLEEGSLVVIVGVAGIEDGTQVEVTR